jgi:hypothetical protein
MVRDWIDFGTYFLLFKLYGLEGNYYAKYFWEVSGWWGGGYGDFGGPRGLTCGIAEVFGKENAGVGWGEPTSQKRDVGHPA